LNISLKPILGGVEGATEGIADNLEDIAVVSFDRPAQDGVVLRQGFQHSCWILLPELSAALDIGE
jgi:hypothetical protein